MSSPAAAAQAAQPGLPGIVLAQAVETGSLQNMSVDEVISTAKRWKVALLVGASLLVLAFLLASGTVRPGGIEKAGLRDVKSLPWIVWLFAGVVVFLAAQSAPVVLEQFGWWRERAEGGLSEDQRRVVVLLTASLLGGVAGLGMLYVLNKSCPNGGMKLSLLDAPVGLGCFALAFPVIALAGIGGNELYKQFSDGAEPPTLAHPTLETLVSWWDRSPSDPWLWGLIAGIVIGVPIVEELVYRVFLQGATIKLLKSPWVGIIVASVIFALVHRLGSPPVPWHALVTILAVGVCCGVAYERTKRVGVPIAMHACFNAVNVALALLASPEAAAPVG